MDNEEIAIPGLEWEKIGYCASIHYHFIKKLKGWSLGFEYGNAPLLKKFDNEYYSFMVGACIGHAVYQKVKPKQ